MIANIFHKIIQSTKLFKFYVRCYARFLDNYAEESFLRKETWWWIKLDINQCAFINSLWLDCAKNIPYKARLSHNFTFKHPNFMSQILAIWIWCSYHTGKEAWKIWAVSEYNGKKCTENASYSTTVFNQIDVTKC